MTNRPLDVTLTYLAGRRLTVTEVINALGIPRSTYYEQREAGTLGNNATQIITAARTLGLNPIDVLVHLGHIHPDEALNYQPS